jgi:hypothetical protein
LTINEAWHIDNVFEVDPALCQRLNHQAITITTFSHDLHWLVTVEQRAGRVDKDVLLTFTFPFSILSFVSK